MARNINIIILDDRIEDAELVLFELKREGFPHTARHARNRDEFSQCLLESPPDIILSDYSLPGFSGPEALTIAREQFPDMPIIFVSGTIGEELAIETLKLGATDYVLKDRIKRLVPAIRRALAESEELARRRRAEASTRRQLERIKALRAIDVAITGSLDLRVTLRVVLDEVIAQLHVDAADILTYSEATQSLDFAIGRGFQTEALKHTHLRLNEGFAGEAAASRKIVEVPDLRESSGDFVRSHHLVKEGFIHYDAIPLVAKGMIKGVLEIFHRRPFEPDEDWRDFLEALAGQAAIALDSAGMFDQMQKAHLALAQSYDRTLEGWVRALDLRDKETEGHSLRVTELSVRLARNMGISDDALVHIRRGALLHDIGKLGIPDAVLLKEGPLDAEEWKVMKEHPVYAFEWLSPIEFLKPALDIPYSHHEKWDGTGYPRGLKGEVIPLAARIFAVVDVWDALRSDRPYRKAWEKEAVMKHIIEQANKHFDPHVVEAFKVLNLNDIRMPIQSPVE